MKKSTVITLILVHASLITMCIIKLHDYISGLDTTHSPLSMVTITLLLMLCVTYIAKHSDVAFDFNYPHSEDTAFTNELEYQ